MAIAMRDGDCLAATPEAKQEHLNKMMAELCGRATGYCKGRGGSMHIADVQKGNLGATGIVGGNIPVATGAALSMKLQKMNRVVVCFFGDGASNTGNFHEGLNMASAWKLPVVYVVENNLYGMSVPFNKVSALPDIAARAAAYDMPGVVVDGMDPLAVYEAISEAVARARRGEGPTLVECKTYRWYGHSKSDPRKYRTKEEEQDWHDRDPLTVFSQQLLDAKVATQEELDAVENRAEKAIEKATEFALASPMPDPAEVEQDVYVLSNPTPAEIEAERRLRERVRSGHDDAQATLLGSDPRRPARRDAARSQGLCDGRGRGPLRRRLCGHARPVRGVWPRESASTPPSPRRSSAARRWARP